MLPKPLQPLPPVPVSDEVSTNSTNISPPSQPQAPISAEGVGSRIRRLLTTSRNPFGLWRRYNVDTLPLHDPEEHIQLCDVIDNWPRDSDEATNSPNAASHGQNPFYPYPNKSSFRLGEWYWTGGIQKSQESFSKLMKIVGDKQFHPEDVRSTRWKEINNMLSVNDFDEDVVGDEDVEWLDEDTRWKKTTVSISIPFHHQMKRPRPQEYIIGDLYHCSLISVICEKLKSRHEGRHFHYNGFELLWKPTEESADIRVHGEIYTLPAFLEVQQEIYDSPGEPGCNLPRVVVALMLASDATHLTSFGNAKLWPCYCFIGNESKYLRCKPNCHLCNHVAYFQTVSHFYPIVDVFSDCYLQLPDAFKDFATNNVGRVPTKAFMAHCRREVLHAQWTILLDDEFIKAYEHGIVVECWDGITRRCYPRILTYSADYPEKCVVYAVLSYHHLTVDRVLLASIHDKGLHLCPRCLIPRTRVQNLGMTLNMKH